jgi:hypothetical protein
MLAGFAGDDRRGRLYTDCNSRERAQRFAAIEKLWAASLLTAVISGRNVTPGKR